MAVCRFCKSEVPDDATRCRFCTSFLYEEKKDDEVTYILDRGLIRFLKYAVPLLGIFTVVGVSLYYVDLKKAREDMDATHAKIEDIYSKTQALDISNQRAQLALTHDQEQLQKQLDTVNKTARDAVADLVKLKEQGASKVQELEGYSERGVIALSKIPASAFDPVQTRRLVITQLVEAFRDVLPKDEYALLQSKLGPNLNGKLKRQIYDAKHGSSLPGILVRGDGDPPSADQDVNQVYDNIQIVDNFLMQTLGRDITEGQDGTVIVTVHYETSYNNGFWSGQQLVLGDGDGSVFRKGAFNDLSIMAAEIAHYIIQQTSGLNYEGQSGAINQSFSYIVAALIQQYQNQQTADQASWLVGEDMIADGRHTALLSLKDPASKMVLSPMSAAMATYAGSADVHINSGIPDHAFYEFAVRLGGNAWDIPFKIWYEAVRHLKSDAGFQNLADATADEAGNRFGRTSAQYRALVGAWAAVGISTDGAARK